MLMKKCTLIRKVRLTTRVYDTVVQCHTFCREYIRESIYATHIVVVKTCLSGFDVTAMAVVGHEYD